jgi:hypothetical protein
LKYKATNYFFCDQNKIGLFYKKIKYLGYFIRIVSIYIFIALVMSFINLFKESENASDVSNAKFIGTIVGQIVFFVVVIWLNIKLYKFGTKLIVKSKVITK